MVERRAIKYGIIKHACEAKRRQLISSIISYSWAVGQPEGERDRREETDGAKLSPSKQVELE